MASTGQIRQLPPAMGDQQIRRLDGPDRSPLGSDQSGRDAVEPATPHRLAVFGVPAVVAEPVTMLAEILGWQVLLFPPGPAMRPPARACLAMLPASSASDAPPLLFWSPEYNLNEHISRAGMSIMDQPLCITRVEQMLETLVCEP